MRLSLVRVVLFFPKIWIVDVHEELTLEDCLSPPSLANTHRCWLLTAYHESSRVPALPRMSRSDESNARSPCVTDG